MATSLQLRVGYRIKKFRFMCKLVEAEKLKADLIWFDVESLSVLLVPEWNILYVEQTLF